jgi:hypothetical protein
MESKGFWRWCVIICKSGFLDFVCRPYFNKICNVSETGSSSVFRLKGRRETLAVAPRGWASLRPGWASLRPGWASLRPVELVSDLVELVSDLVEPVSDLAQGAQQLGFLFFLLTWRRKNIQLPKRCKFYWNIDDGQSPKNGFYRFTVLILQHSTTHRQVKGVRKDCERKEIWR